MLINRNSRPWVIVCAILFLLALAAYLPYHMTAEHGPHGGSVMGLIYGFSGTAMMLFAAALGLRRRFRSMPLGSGRLWLTGHVWLGTLSYPIILFHAGIQVWRSPVGLVLMGLFTVVFVSGVVGLIVQQYLPTMMIRAVPGESIYEQIPHVLEELRDETKARMDRSRRETAVAEGGGGTATLAPPRTSEIEDFYTRLVEPFLAEKLPARSPFSSAEATIEEFARLEARLRQPPRELLNDLRKIVDQRRQLERQRRLFAQLHGWLLMHVPLSYALVLLAVVHAVVALRYGLTLH